MTPIKKPIRIEPINTKMKFIIPETKDGSYELYDFIIELFYDILNTQNK